MKYVVVVARRRFSLLFVARVLLHMGYIGTDITSGDRNDIAVVLQETRV